MRIAAAIYDRSFWLNFRTSASIKKIAAANDHRTDVVSATTT